MDEKHRKYCIKLGNPYMMEERYQDQIRTEQLNTSWIPDEKQEQKNWFKSNNNY